MLLENNGMQVKARVHGGDNVMLRVVKDYKHLGSSLADNEHAEIDTPNRVSTAMTAYAPISSSFRCSENRGACSFETLLLLGH